MAESNPVMFSHHEVLELLLKHRGIHEGIWSIALELQFGALNAGSEDSVLPAGLVGISKIGIAESKVLNSISLDASIVNPKKTRKKLTKPKAKKPA
jgi:hypothetical protein